MLGGVLGADHTRSWDRIFRKEIPLPDARDITCLICMVYQITQLLLLAIPVFDDTLVKPQKFSSFAPAGCTLFPRSAPARMHDAKICASFAQCGPLWLVHWRLCAWVVGCGSESPRHSGEIDLGIGEALPTSPFDQPHEHNVDPPLHCSS
jgi:hypothetical protein